MGSRKDDPLSNVTFVKAVESHPVLWNFNHHNYNKKEETQKAWLEISAMNSDSVETNRNRWRTIRSSFFRSRNSNKTNKGRQKRCYYLSNHLKFLEPYTRARNNTTQHCIGTPSLRCSASPHTHPLTIDEDMNTARPSRPTSHAASNDSFNSAIRATDQRSLNSHHSDSNEVVQTDGMDDAVVMQQRLANLKTEHDIGQPTPGPSGFSTHKVGLLTPYCPRKNQLRLLTTLNTGIGRHSSNDLARNACVSVPVSNDFCNESAGHQSWENSKCEENHGGLVPTTISDSNQYFFNSLIPFINRMPEGQLLQFRKDVLDLLNKYSTESGSTTPMN